MEIRIIVGLLTMLRQFRQRDTWTRQQLEAHQARALQRLRTHAYVHSPFYQAFHRGLTDQPLEKLPVLTKAMLMEYFDDMVTDRSVRRGDVEQHVTDLHGDERFLDRYWINATSGSTGQPGLFLFDRTEWTTILASFARAHEWAGAQVRLTHRMRMASVASTSPWHMSARVGATLRSWWMPALRLAASDPLDHIVEQLNRWQPEMLVAYASIARLLADEQRAGHLQIAPHLVFTSSEVLTDETRRRIEDVWGSHLFNQYGATETGGLAAECMQHRGMHLAEDLSIVEVVDANHRPVPAGAYGDKVLVTTLFSRTLPLIRYEISDRVRLATAPCLCGRPFMLIDGIQGRTEEALRFPATSAGEVVLQPLVFERILDRVPASGWQVVQEPDRLRVLLSGVRDGFADSALIAALQHALIEQDAVVPLIQVQRVAALPRTAAGKAPLIKSTLSRSTPQGASTSARV